MFASSKREIEDAARGHVGAVRRLFVDVLAPEQLDVFAEVAETVVDRLDTRSAAA
jgi:hypothetical protein